ncbi:MAG: tRNA pseudouridine(55) synthase TruB [Pseudomonadota bacterium]
MGRRRRHPRFLGSGVLLIDKPAGPTSHDVVEDLRRRFQPAKLGHAGTLDPFATGLLVMAFNQATRLVDLMGLGAKTYAATLSLGRTFDTGDPTGQETASAPVPELSQDQVARALKAMEGPRLQEPPAYSAAKLQGKPLYAYARAGQEVHKPPRPITVHEARLLALRPGEIDFVMRCSRGTYLRSLAQELALALGSVGHLKALRRTESQPFGLDQAVELETALDWNGQELAQNLLPLDQALARCGLPVVELDDDLAWQLRQGRILPSQALLPEGASQAPQGQAFMVLDPAGAMVAVLRWLTEDQRRPGRAYETIRVFPEPSDEGPGGEASASALGAE